MSPEVLTGETVHGEVVGRVLEHALDGAHDDVTLEERVHETIYAEERRLANQPHDPRFPADRAFVSQLRHDLAHRAEGELSPLLRRIVDRYATEIGGHFAPRVYGVATRMLPAGLGALLHGSAAPHDGFFAVDDRVLLAGETQTLRDLASVGTVILAPTHVSNLDSLLTGYAIHRLGLPPFAYGAGLNLFTSPVVGYFMQHLGAYTVDRKKTDPLYRDTLREYATTLLARGQHNLFFPGGTRARSGAIEGHLKMGLLGTAPIAFRRALEANAERPRVFVVPCTLTYPLVLEASSLVQDWLRTEGGPHYVDLHDEFEHPRRWLEFIRGLGELDLHIHVRFGRPLDVVGNEVDGAGVSHDPHGREVDPARYFMVSGRLVEDTARDAEYTRGLASRLVDAYRRDTVALPTSVVAFACFERLRAARKHLDLFRFLRALGPCDGVPLDDIVEDVGTLRDELERLAARGAVQLSADLRESPPADVVARALATFATYHPTPVALLRDGKVCVGDANLLFYYRNRLDGYGLGGRAGLFGETGLARGQS